MNKRLLAVAVFSTFMAISAVTDAATSSRGGFSGGSRSMSSVSSSRGGFSSASRPSITPSTPSRPSAIPTTPSNPNRGGFNSASRPPTTATAPSRSTTTTTTTTTMNRTYSSPYVSPGGYYGGWGMGYGYSNGLLTGLIIGNMMHPHGTVMYAGGGSYNNNALLYPDGRVVDQSGRVVGTYVNGQFTAVQNGQIVAQPVPADAGAQPQQSVIINTGPSVGDIVFDVLLGIGCVVLIIVLLGMI